MTSIPLGSVAMALGRRGVHVMSLLPLDKRPATRKGYQDATTNLKMIHKRWGRLPQCNVGIACEASGLVVIDCDRGKPWPLAGEPPQGCAGGDDLLVLLAQEAGQDPAFIYADGSCSVMTPSGGLHLYYRAPQGERIRSSVGTLAPWVDVRAAGGYVVGPWSVTPVGDYRPLSGWEHTIHSAADPDFQPTGLPVMVDLAFDPPELPAWLLERLVEPERTEPQSMWDRLLAALDREPVQARGAYATAALNAEVAAVASATKGGRNNTLNLAAFKLGTLVGAGALDEVSVREALESAALACGLPEDEARQSLSSGLRAGMARPREVAGL